MPASRRSATPCRVRRPFTPVPALESTPLNVSSLLTMAVETLRLTPSCSLSRTTIRRCSASLLRALCLSTSARRTSTPRYRSPPPMPAAVPCTQSTRTPLRSEATRRPASSALCAHTLRRTTVETLLLSSRLSRWSITRPSDLMWTSRCSPAGTTRSTCSSRWAVMIAQRKRSSSFPTPRSRSISRVLPAVPAHLPERASLFVT
mmetsp:Transcript_18787/g.72466  ORF Transcript_18787/g.72466 Transcript_18787/m.72466 type:complete len:204 (+) Transcript_18787:911-1522(+)